MKVGDEVIFTDSDGNEHPAVIEFEVPRAVHPLPDPTFDLSQFDQKYVGGGQRDEISYLISIPNPDFIPGRDRKKRSLIWPKLSRIRPVVTAKPKVNGRKTTKK